MTVLERILDLELDAFNLKVFGLLTVGGEKVCFQIEWLYYVRQELLVVCVRGVK